jgi:hypothetical protein
MAGDVLRGLGVLLERQRVLGVGGVWRNQAKDKEQGD